MQTVGHFINGQLCQADHEPTAPVYNPASGRVSKNVALATVDTVAAAVDAAERAFVGWRDTQPAKRARIMFAFKDLLQQHADEIAELISQEHGKILHDALGEFGRGMEIVEYACGAPELLKGEFSKNVGPGIDSWSEFQPLGVVAGITPFNFPAMVPMWMFPMAIVCGNTFILKPSEKAPSAALKIAQLLHQAGLPEGVFNVVNGDKTAVDALLQHPKVQAISFVGSTPIAKSIYTAGTAQGKRVQALGGAKNHAILMPDADLDNAVDALMGAAYGSCGERCMAISVVVAVGAETADNLVDKLSTELQGLTVGPGHDNTNNMGPLINQPHFQRVQNYIAAGVEQGARLVVDGRGYQVPGYEDGYFLQGSLFDHVTPDMTIYQEEIFGPVLCVVRVDTMAQAMQLINDHPYGNGTCIFTRDGEAARYFTDRIQVGMVGVNVALPVPVASHSFGGWKDSLFGDLHAYGPDSVRFYTRRKTVTQRWPSSNLRQGQSYSFPS